MIGPKCRQAPSGCRVENRLWGEGGGWVTREEGTGIVQVSVHGPEWELWRWEKWLVFWMHFSRRADFEGERERGRSER